jgi:quercetin dioxygenase-like cupin family protein
MKKYPGFTLFFLFLQSICQSQVPVSQEPMHHKVLDNGHVRLLDVHIPPGDTTQFHIHATPSVFLLLTEANTGSQVISEEDRSSSSIKHYGNIWFEGFYTKPRIHRVFNHDSHEYRVMDIELTNKNYILIDSPIRQPAEAFTFLFEEKPLRAYRLNLGPSGDVYLPERKADILLIQLSDSVETMQVNEKSFTQKGEFLYIPSGKPISLKNNGKGNAVFAFFELK